MKTNLIKKIIAASLLVASCFCTYLLYLNLGQYYKFKMLTYGILSLTTLILSVVVYRKK